jgi:phenylpyruvate tautomerase PptA (4-oxalocrotonate tautomerase family)
VIADEMVKMEETSKQVDRLIEELTAMMVDLLALDMK